MNLTVETPKKMQNPKTQTPYSLITKQHNSKTPKTKLPNSLIPTRQTNKTPKIQNS
jgi:hypothetical protein